MSYMRSNATATGRVSQGRLEIWPGRGIMGFLVAGVKVVCIAAV